MLKEFAISKLDERFRKAYFALSEKTGKNIFTVEDIDTFLEEKGFKNINEVLAELRKVDLISVEKDPSDNRKSIYKFVDATSEAEKRKESTDILNRNDVIKLLKAGADLIRTSVDYKTLMIFLFYKALSDKWNKKKDSFIEKNLPEKQAYMLANAGYYKLYDPSEDKLYTWQEVTKSKDTIKELANSIKKIAELNRDTIGEIEKLLEILGFFGFISEDNIHLLESLVNLYGAIDFSKFEHDIIGDAYQWILSYFAPQKAKEGEVYTPKEISTLIAKILDPVEGDSILDPASGSDSMLIEIYDFARKKLGKDKPNISLYGQERNDVMATIGKLNFILHDIDNFKIFIGDSLRNPKFAGELNNAQATHIIANPPWNLDGYSEDTFKENPEAQKIYRKYLDNGFPSKQSADWAWVQLMLYFSEKKVGVILDSGALFRGGKEQNIRQAVLEKDLVESVILLPEKLFYNTQAPGILLVLNKHKTEKQKGKVIFINASMEFEKHDNVRKLNKLGENNIDNIVNAYKGFDNIEGLAQVAELTEINKNDYNLNVSLYINPVSDEEEIVLEKEFAELMDIEKKEQKILAEVYGYLEGIIKAEAGE